MITDYGRQSRRRPADARRPGRAEPAARPGGGRHRVQPQPARRQRGPEDAPHLVVEPRRQPGAVRADGAVGRLRGQRRPRPARRHRHQRAGQRRAARRGRVRPGRDDHPGRGSRDQLPARAAVADQFGLRRRLQVDAGVAGQAHGQPLERPRGLHAAAQQLRRHRQPRRAPGLARQRPARRLRRVLVRTAPTCSPPAAPGTRVDLHRGHGGQRHQRLADQRDRRPRRQRRPRQQRPANPRHRRPGPADPLRPRRPGPRRALRDSRARTR